MPTSASTRTAPDGRWQGFPVAARPLDFYRAICERHGLLLQDLGELAALGHRSGSATQDSQHMLRITAISAGAAPVAGTA
jgi:hypothetical protein